MRTSKADYYQTPRGRASRLWGSAKRRAAKSGIDFLLDAAWIEGRLEAGMCEATGLPLDLRAAGERRCYPFTPTLDRRDPNQGYTPENTRVVAFAFNAAVGTWGDDVLFLLARERTRQLAAGRP